MAFTNKGRDLAMDTRNKATGKFDITWDATTGNPKFDDTESHRVLSLLVEHRQSQLSPGYLLDTTGNRGSLLHTLKNMRTSTPSQAEAYARDALKKAVDEQAIKGVDVEARKLGPSTIELTVDYTANRKKQTARISI